MDFEGMSHEELIRHIKEVHEMLDNVIVLWGGKREFRETFAEVARNANSEYSQEEARNAATILEARGAFEAFVEMLQDSFERGGINYVLQEKIAAIMQDVALRYRQH
jgi:hypothetical protein